MDRILNAVLGRELHNGRKIHENFRQSVNLHVWLAFVKNDLLRSLHRDEKIVHFFIILSFRRIS